MLVPGLVQGPLDESASQTHISVCGREKQTVPFSEDYFLGLCSANWVLSKPKTFAILLMFSFFFFFSSFPFGPFSRNRKNLSCLEVFTLWTLIKTKRNRKIKPRKEAQANRIISVFLKDRTIITQKTWARDLTKSQRFTTEGGSTRWLGKGTQDISPACSFQFLH